MSILGKLRNGAAGLALLIGSGVIAPPAHASFLSDLFSKSPTHETTPSAPTVAPTTVAAPSFDNPTMYMPLAERDGGGLTATEVLINRAVADAMKQKAEADQQKATDDAVAAAVNRAKAEARAHEQAAIQSAVEQAISSTQAQDSVTQQRAIDTAVQATKGFLTQSADAALAGKALPTVPAGDNYDVLKNAQDHIAQQVADAQKQAAEAQAVAVTTAVNSNDSSRNVYDMIGGGMVAIFGAAAGLFLRRKDKKNSQTLAQTQAENARLAQQLAAANARALTAENKLKTAQTQTQNTPPPAATTTPAPTQPALVKDKTAPMLANFSAEEIARLAKFETAVNQDARYRAAKIDPAKIDQGITVYITPDSSTPTEIKACSIVPGSVTMHNTKRDEALALAIKAMVANNGTSFDTQSPISAGLRIRMEEMVQNMLNHNTLTGPDGKEVTSVTFGKKTITAEAPTLVTTAATSVKTPAPAPAPV